MRQVAITLALSLVVAGCGNGSEPSPSASAMEQQPPSGSAMDRMMRAAGGWDGCPGGLPPDVWVTGVITPNEDGFAAIRDDEGDLHTLVWGSSNTGVVEWGRRYRIGGNWFRGEGNDLWACGGATAVIPQ